MNSEGSSCGRSISRILSSCSSVFICGFLVFSIPSSAAAGISLTDDLGRKVELKGPAQRIVTLAPFLAELAFTAGAGARLVGASAHSDYPAEARGLPQVAGAMGPDVEALAALRPDLALAWDDSIRREDVERIERLGVRVFVARAKGLDDPARLLEAVARMAGTDASAAIRSYRERLRKARAAYAGRARVRTFVEVWHQPLTTIGARHWINDMLELCGGENVFSDLAPVAPVVSWEELYRRDPRLVLGAGAAGGEGAFRASWETHPALSAVREGRVAFVDADVLQRPSLRLADGVASVCAALERAR